MKSGIFPVASLVILLCGQAQLALADDKAPEPKSKMVEEEVQVVEGVDCALGKDIRHLEVQTREAGCSLQYFKFGKRNEMAVAKRGVDVCKNGLNKIRKTLEGSGYQCK